MTRSAGGTVTMADVAGRAGVSIATASRALSDSVGVSASTRARVRAIADELSYVVSPEASGLSKGRTGRVGVVVPSPSRWFFGEAIEGAGRILSDAGLDLLLYVAGSAAERHRFFFRLPAKRKVDAVLVLGIPVTPTERAQLASLGVSVVAAGGQVSPYPYVSIDDRTAGRQAMNHLLYLGHQRIAMIDAIDPNATSWPDSGRTRAYTEALAEAGIPLDEELLVRVEWGLEAGARAMERLLSLATPPTAVFAHSDQLAFGALRTLRRAGIRVPQDISVIGIDDHPYAEQADLTTIHQDPRKQGELAAEMIVSILRGESEPESLVVRTHLVPRASTAPPSR